MSKLKLEEFTGPIGTNAARSIIASHGPKKLYTVTSFNEHGVPSTSLELRNNGNVKGTYESLVPAIEAYNRH